MTELVAPATPLVGQIFESNNYDNWWRVDYIGKNTCLCTCVREGSCKVGEEISFSISALTHLKSFAPVCDAARICIERGWEVSQRLHHPLHGRQTITGITVAGVKLDRSPVYWQSDSFGEFEVAPAREPIVFQGKVEEWITNYDSHTRSMTLKICFLNLEDLKLAERLYAARDVEIVVP